MKDFFYIELKHKKYEELSEDFYFHDLDLFCHYAETLALDDRWHIFSSTNTKNVSRYISVLNTNINRRFIDNEEDFTCIEDVDLYYNKYYQEYPFTVKDILDKMYKNNIEDEFSYDEDDFLNDIDHNSPHKIYFNSETYKNFYDIENIKFFLEKMKSNNIPESMYKVFINYKSINLEEYYNIMKIFQPELILPNSITSSSELNDFIYSYNKMLEIKDCINSFK